MQGDAPETFKTIVRTFNSDMHVELVGGNDSDDPNCLYKAYQTCFSRTGRFRETVNKEKAPTLVLCWPRDLRALFRLWIVFTGKALLAIEGIAFVGHCGLDVCSFRAIFSKMGSFLSFPASSRMWALRPSIATFVFPWRVTSNRCVGPTT